MSELETAARRTLATIENVLLNFRGPTPPTKAQSDWLIEMAGRLLAGAADDLRGALPDAPDAVRGGSGEG